MALAPLLHFCRVQQVSKKREARLHDGTTLSTIRRLRGEKQQTLTRKTPGVSEGMLANLETNRRQPSEDTLRSLAAALDVPVAALGKVLRDGELWCDSCKGIGVIETAVQAVA